MKKYRLITFNDEKGEVEASMKTTDYHRLIGLANRLKKDNDKLKFEIVEVKFEVCFN